MLLKFYLKIYIETVFDGLIFFISSFFQVDNIYYFHWNETLMHTPAERNAVAERCVFSILFSGERRFAALERCRHVLFRDLTVRVVRLGLEAAVRRRER